MVHAFQKCMLFKKKKRFKKRFVFFKASSIFALLLVLFVQLINQLKLYTLIRNKLQHHNTRKNKDAFIGHK